MITNTYIKDVPHSNTDIKYIILFIVNSLNSV